ncbi:PfkB family carbohydrate kinase [Tessaracoccus coleopterorum]|uniref:PfkB family carbohydrate kinase n=1 Tax=Tessaracoccus coleopterorum TaxID=2714950 RepID=UPI0038CDB3EB
MSRPRGRRRPPARRGAGRRPVALGRPHRPDPRGPLRRFISSNGAGDTFTVAFLAAALDGRDAVDSARWAAAVVGRAIQGDPLVAP